MTKQTKNVVSVEPNDCHRDIMGRPVSQGDFVIAVQNNRPFPFKVLKLNDVTVTMVPAFRRKDIRLRHLAWQVPAYKNYRRECWNVYVIPPEEAFMFTLQGKL